MGFHRAHATVARMVVRLAGLCRGLGLAMVDAIDEEVAAPFEGSEFDGLEVGEDLVDAGNLALACGRYCIAAGIGVRLLLTWCVSW